jgi:hypothetical protein
VETTGKELPPGAFFKDVLAGFIAGLLVWLITRRL